MAFDRTKTAHRLGGFAATVTASLALLAAPASAHVTISPTEAESGSTLKLAFSVPNEKESSVTNKIEIDFPTDKVFPSVYVKPQPGWQNKVDKVKLKAPLKTDDGTITDAVSRVTWEGGQIKPGDFLEFEVSAGPVPEDTDRVIFKVLQTYADGEVARWIESPAGDGKEPEHPAPVLKITKASTSDDGATNGKGTDDSDSASATKSDVDSSKGLASAALALGVVGTVLGALGVIRRRRQ